MDEAAVYPARKEASSGDPATWCNFETTLAHTAPAGGTASGSSRARQSDRPRRRRLRDPTAELSTARRRAAPGNGHVHRGIARWHQHRAASGKPGRSARKATSRFYDGLAEEGKPGGRYLTVTGHRLYTATIGSANRPSNWWLPSLLADGKRRRSTTERHRTEQATKARLARAFACRKERQKVRARQKPALPQ